jgi:hypothetical protein
MAVEYEAPTVPSGKDVVRMVATAGGGLIVIENALLTLTGVGTVESASWIVKLVVLAANGVPEIAPVPAFNWRPPGRDPATTDHV